MKHVFVSLSLAAALFCASSAFAEFRSLNSCENSSVRLEQNVASHYSDTTQLVINNGYVINFLLQRGAISPNQISGNQVILFGGMDSQNYFWSQMPRDNGTILYRVTNFGWHSMRLEVGFTTGDPRAHYQFIPFMDYVFNGCTR